MQLPGINWFMPVREVCLLDGWKLGPEKDVENRISPYLVSWDDLPSGVKEWDRQTVRAIPEFLAEIELEVRRNT